MNYRHAYHAGNFADVVKHIVLTRFVEYLKLKDKAFRVIDTHAGIGLYDLSSEQARKTGEWHDGIGSLIDATLPSRSRQTAWRPISIPSVP
jgi:23S rRNA (adenine2030-N6)-methyltransferase